MSKAAPRQLPNCKMARILPVRYALSGQINPFVDAKKPFLYGNPGNHFWYTFRTIRPGSYVYVYLEDLDIPYFHGYVYTNGEFYEPNLGLRPGKWLSFPVCGDTVWFAVSDIPWNGWQRQKIMDDVDYRNQRMHCFKHAKGEHLRYDAEIRSIEDIKYCVEEFRSHPGHLRSLHEYEDLCEFFDPELEHFDKHDEEANEKKWRWSQTKFLWKDEDETQKFIQEFKQDCDHHYMLALSDPAGIAMDCARLHVNAMQALGDHARWYTDAVQLAKTIEINEEFLRITDQGHTTKITRKEGVEETNPLYHSAEQYDVELKTLSKAVIQRYEKQHGPINAAVTELLDFWYAWLTTPGAFSLSLAMKDSIEEIPTDEGTWALVGKPRQDTVAYCIDGLCRHSASLKKALELFTDESGPFQDMVVDALRMLIPHKGQRDQREELGRISLALVDFLKAEKRKASQPFQKKVRQELAAALEMYLPETDGNTPENIWDYLEYRWSSDIESDDEYVAKPKGNPAQGMRFLLFGYYSQAESSDKAKFPWPEFSHENAKAIFEKCFPDEGPAPDFMMRLLGKKYDGIDKHLKLGMKTLDVGMGLYALNSAWDDFWSNKDNRQGKALLDGAAAAIQVTQGGFEAYAAGRALIGSTTPAILPQIKLDKISGAITAVSGGADALHHIKNNDNIAAMGSAVQGASGVAIVIWGSNPAFTILGITAGAVADANKTTAVSLRIKNSYFGATSKSRLEYERPDWMDTCCLVPLSYEKAYVPEHSHLIGDRTPKDTWANRHPNIQLDLDMFEMLHVGVSCYTRYDDKNLFVRFVAPRVCGESRLTVKELSIRYHAVKDVEYTPEELAAVPWVSGIVDRQPHWELAFPLDRQAVEEAIRRAGVSDEVIIFSGVTPSAKLFTVKATVAFEYANTERVDKALGKLREEAQVLNKAKKEELLEAEKEFSEAMKIFNTADERAKRAMQARIRYVTDRLNEKRKEYAELEERVNKRFTNPMERELEYTLVKHQMVSGE